MAEQKKSNSGCNWIFIGIIVVVIIIAIGFLFLASGGGDIPEDSPRQTETASAATDEQASAQLAASQTQDALEDDSTGTAEAFTNTPEPSPTRQPTRIMPTGAGGGGTMLPTFPPTFTPTTTPQRVSTATQIADLNTTATEAVLQMTVDALETRNAAVLATQTSSSQTNTDATSEVSATEILASFTPLPTETPMPVSTGGVFSTEVSSLFTPEPTIIASAELQIRDTVSGEIFGDGIISLYAPDAITNEQTVRIDLDLDLANIYITPTPAGAIEVVPVPTRITATPRTHNSLGTPLPTPTERVARYSETGIQFYQRMGASLFCAPETFAGCDEERNESQSKLVTMTTTRFTWLLTQQSDLSGTQDLTIELWAVFNNLDGELEYITQWEHPFTIEIVNERTFPIPLVLGGIVLIGLGAVIGVMSFRQNKSAQGFRFGKDKTKPKVFISYRRKPSWSIARSISNSLERWGADVFLDVDDINEGRFAEIIRTSIEECDYFVPILAPSTLESIWVRREIELAIELKKSIIPMTTDGFDFYGVDLPEGLEELSSHNAITITPEYFEAAVKRLASRFLKLDTEK